MSEPYDLLLGRRTYDIFASHFSEVDETSESNVLNTATKYVVTSNPYNLDWQNTVALTGEMAEEVKRLKQQDGPLLQVHGSWQLIQSLLAHDLVDEFRLWTFPILVGPGKRLFAPDASPKNLALIKTGSTSNGVVMSIYRRNSK